MAGPTTSDRLGEARAARQREDLPLELQWRTGGFGLAENYSAREFGCSYGSPSPRVEKEKPRLDKKGHKGMQGASK